MYRFTNHDRVNVWEKLRILTPFLISVRMVQILGITKKTSLISFPPTAGSETTVHVTGSSPALHRSYTIIRSGLWAGDHSSVSATVSEHPYSNSC